MITAFLLLIYSGSVFTQKDLLLSSQPQTILLGSPVTPSLTLTCAPVNPSIATVFQMAIGRNSSGTETEIARVSSSTPNTVTISDSSYGSRMKALGSIAQNSKSIQVEILSLVCEDATDYYCKSVHLTTAGSVGQSQVSLHVEATKSAESITMTHSPQETEYEIGSEVTFTCSGKIGNDINITNPEMDWSWEWRNDSSEAWTDYPAPENITYNKPVPVDDCTYTGSTDLVHVTTDEEIQPEFRCIFQGKFTATEEIKVKPKPTPGVPVYPHCDEPQLMAAVSEMKTISNDSAGFCSSGRRERSEAVLMEFCEAPETRLWTAGPKVMDNCQTLAPQTPIALFQFGLFVDNNAGLSGVFMGCSDNGFTMTAQMCGHPVDLYHLDMKQAGVSEAENPYRYHVVVYNDETTTHRPILVG